VQKPNKYGTSTLRSGGGERACDVSAPGFIRITGGDYGQDKAAPGAGVYDTRMRFQLARHPGAIASLTNIAVG
jgi:hypothetical protein